MHYVRLAAALVLVAACTSTDQPTAPRAHPDALTALSEGSRGAVYTQSNAVAGNAVLAYHRGADGSLTPAGSFPTSGTGTGAGLGSQGAVVLSNNGRYLLAVNAGSNDVSSFAVEEDGGLTLRSTVSSGGTTPISVTIAGRLVYVLNAGGAGNIAGFRLANDGSLSAIAGSSRPLSSNAAGPAQIQFARQGRVLVVTEKNTNVIDTYLVGEGGLAAGPQVHPSSGTTPFGFAISNTGLLIVSEAFGGAPDAGAASSYEIGHDGALHLLSASVPTTETAACWFVVTDNHRFAYTTNAGSGSVTGYRLSRGRLTLLDSDGVTAFIGAGTSPVDLALSGNSRFLYTLNSGTETIASFTVNADGSLAALAGGVSGLPDGASGLAAR